MRERSQNAGNVLSGKKIIFLGSSVTYGSASHGVSFADFIGERNGCKILKEAVSGTTLADGGPDSYVSRLKRLQPTENTDLFVCQLSTNDAARRKPAGRTSAGKVPEDFDVSTTAGAIEFIIDFAKRTYGCPVAFYTSPRYDSAEYEELVALLGAIAGKWEIPVIDLWNDDVFNALSDEQRKRWMADPIHPTAEGYLEWWTPRFEQAFEKILKRAAGNAVPR